MKANNFSKNYNGQMEPMGKGEIRQRSNSNSLQSNYQMPMKKHQKQNYNQMKNKSFQK